MSKNFYYLKILENIIHFKFYLQVSIQDIKHVIISKICLKFTKLDYFTIYCAIILQLNFIHPVTPNYFNKTPMFRDTILGYELSTVSYNHTDLIPKRVKNNVSFK